MPTLAPTRRLALTVLLGVFLPAVSQGQLFHGPVTRLPVASQRYLLVIPTTPQVRSYATVSGRQLTVARQGRVFRYLRRPALDSADGRYVGYHSLGTGRRLRWPVGGRGRMLISDGLRGTWRPSQMVITPLPTHYAYPSTTHVVKFVPNRPLPPALVSLQNTHREDLQLGIIDRRDPSRRAQQILVKAGSVVRHPFERDAGGSLVSMLVDYAGRPVQVLDRIPIPPKTYYDVAVYEYKIVSTFYDRTLKGAARFRPVSQRKGTRSLAVFALPAGAGLVSGSAVDIHREATTANNPGAVRLLPQLNGIDR